MGIGSYIVGWSLCTWCPKCHQVLTTKARRLSAKNAKLQLVGLPKYMMLADLATDLVIKYDQVLFLVK